MSALGKYMQRQTVVNSLLCVGLDGTYEKIPPQFKTKKFPQFEFNKWIIDQTHEFAAAFKPQLAYYEARGDQGWHELKLTMEYLQSEHPDIFTIADAKRADIGSTNEAYAQTFFDDLGFDAMTLHPYLGKEALQPFLDRHDKVSIILCRTSNPGAGELQDLLVDGKPVWQVLAEKIRDDWNSNQNCMIVVGATYPDELAQLRSFMGEIPFLVPGIGAQGGDLPATLKGGLTANKDGLLIHSSRAIIFSPNPGEAAKNLRDEINRYR